MIILRLGSNISLGCEQGVSNSLMWGWLNLQASYFVSLANLLSLVDCDELNGVVS